jgi:hypothetical protein
MAAGKAKQNHSDDEKEGRPSSRSEVHPTQAQEPKVSYRCMQPCATIAPQRFEQKESVNTQTAPFRHVVGAELTKITASASASSNDANKKRWILKFNDAKAIAQIDVVLSRSSPRAAAQSRPRSPCSSPIFDSTRIALMFACRFVNCLSFEHSLYCR